MSRRKQLNPKPVHKGDAEPDSLPENMTTLIESEEEHASRRLSVDDMDTSSDRFSSNCSSPIRPDSRSPSTHSVRPLNQFTEPQADQIDRTHQSSPIQIKQEPIEHPSLPKLRLNAILASDPALQPFAKDIKHTERARTESSQSDDETKDPSRSIALTPPSPFVSRNFEELILRNGGRPSNITSDTLALAARSGFTCDPCGIKFSSLSTLEAHQTYYCSHSRKEGEDVKGAATTPVAQLRVASANQVEEPPAKVSRIGKQYACTHCSYSADKKVSLNRHMRMHQTSPAASSGTSNGGESTAELNSLAHQTDCYCGDCDIRFSSLKTFRAHKQHYCSGRHRDGSGPSAIKSNISKSRSHSPVDVATTPPSVVPTPTPQPYLALPTNPIVIIPYSLIRTASVLPGPLSSLSPNATDPDQTCFLLKNGSLQSFAHALTIPIQLSPPNRMTISPSRPKSSESVQKPLESPVPSNRDRKEISHKMESTPSGTNLNHVKNAMKTDATTPLDLSVRRLSIEQMNSRDRSDSISSGVSGIATTSGRVSVEQRRLAKDGTLHEHIVCAPSLPGSPPQTPSPKLNMHSPRSILSPSPVSTQTGIFYRNPVQHPSVFLRHLLPNDMTEALSPPDRQAIMALGRRMSVARSSVSKKSPPGPPQMFVKQGASKCQECNIVFCKYENFLAHKKHYCSAREQPDTDRVAHTTASPSLSPGIVAPKNPIPQQTLPYQQLICAACGIKFTSLDNLNAHQMYYCPKRTESSTKLHESVNERKCPKCRTHHDASKACPLNQNLYKCPICEVVSTNAAESKRHLDTHAGVKAFRCSICQYRGNTLRGMRTHIRMHFDKKSCDFNEENYITCILEENSVELTPSIVKSPMGGGTELDVQTETSSCQSSLATTPTHLHSCDECNYSSTYKGNVVRHVKLVHSHMHPLQPSSSPRIGEGGESLLLAHQESVAVLDISPIPPKTPYSVNFKAEPLVDRPSDGITRTTSPTLPTASVKTETAVEIDAPGEFFGTLRVNRNSTASVT